MFSVTKHGWLLCFFLWQWVLSPKYFNFPLPITLTMIHMGFSGAVAFLLVRVFKVRYIFLQLWKMLMFLVFYFFYLMIAIADS